MSRNPNPDTVIVKPSSNIYTALAAAALVASLVALVALWMRADELFGGLI